MVFESKTTLALISFLVIAFLVYPMVVSTQWSKLEFSSPHSEAAPLSAPLDWRALVSE
jgi:hypothetical protein